MGASLVLGIIALVLGLGLRYWINRRKFYRRSATGAEGFSSYEKSVIIKTSLMDSLCFDYIRCAFPVELFKAKKDKRKSIPKYGDTQTVKHLLLLQIFNKWQA